MPNFEPEVLRRVDAPIISSSTERAVLWALSPLIRLGGIAAAVRVDLKGKP